MEPLLFQYQYSQVNLYSIFTTRQWIEIILDKFKEERKDIPEYLVEAFRSFMNNLLICNHGQYFKEHEPIAEAIQKLGYQDVGRILHEINSFHLQLIKYLEPQDEQKTLQTSPKAVCR